MLWPEGPPSRLSNLGIYFDPPIEGESLKDFSKSGEGSYIATVSRSVIGMFRVKPLVALALYPRTSEKVEEEGEYFKVKCSNDGTIISVATKGRYIRMFEVLPREELEEVLRSDVAITPGPGEAIGARELYLKEVMNKKCEHEVLDLVTLEDSLMIVSSDHIEIIDYETKTDSQTTPINNFVDWPSNLPWDGQIAQVVSAPPFVGICTTEGSSYLIDLSCRKSYAVSPDSHGIEFNMRMSQVSIITGEKISLHSLVKPEEKIASFSSPESRFMRWAPSGYAVFIGLSNGSWAVVSVLGMTLFNGEGSASEAVWLGGTWGDSLAILIDGSLYIYQLLRMGGFGSVAKPILWGNGRLLLYNDKLGIAKSGNHWQTVPLPTWYIASNWPLVAACTSEDSRYVAVAGAVGVMYFSVTSRQWKELADREAQVRGGLTWHGRHLVAACIKTKNQSSLAIYSPVVSTEEEQIIASCPLASPVIAMNLQKHRLAVLLAAEKLLIFDIEHHDFELVKEMPLSGVLGASMAHVVGISLVDERRTLFQVDFSLILLSSDGDRRYQRQIIATPIETFFWDNEGQALYVFDGHEVLVTDLDMEQQVAAIPLSDAYPILVNPNRGILALIEADSVRSTDGSFVFAKPRTSTEVFVPWVLEATLLGATPEVAKDIAEKYESAPYFSQVLETLLFRAVTSSEEAELAPAVALVKSFGCWASVLAGCSRKVEMHYWPRLFKLAGTQPLDLFHEALRTGDLDTARDFYLVATQGDAAPIEEAQELYRAALKAKNFVICHELCEFLLAVDSSGSILRKLQQIRA